MTTELEQLLARSWFFSDLTEREIKDLAVLAHTRSVRARQQVVRRGDPSGPIFAVLRGRLKVTTPGIERDTAFRVLGPGELFGELSALDGAPRSATVTAIEPCQLAVLARNDFLDHLARHPAVSQKLLAVLVRRVRELSERAEDHTVLSAPARLAKCLLGFADRGVTQPEGIVCDVRLSQGELGALVDASRETVNKTLRLWKESRTVTHEPTRIVVHNRRALEQISRGP